jgi:hypothetical protein
MPDSSPHRPDERTEDRGQAVRDAAALYRQIWGTDPEPTSGWRSRPSRPRPQPRGNGEADPDPGEGSVADRLAAVERRLEELIPQLESEEIEALEEDGRSLATLETRLAAMEKELREFTRSFNGRVDRLERNLHRFVEVSRRIAPAHEGGEAHGREFED